MARLSTIFLACFLTGCSTAPVADFLDWVHPGKLEQGQFHGGVENTPSVVMPVQPLPGPPPGATVPPPPPPAGSPPAQWPTAPLGPPPAAPGSY